MDVGSHNDKITLLLDKYDAWMNVGTLVKVDGKDLTIAMNSADRAASDLVKDADNNDLTSLDFTKLGKDYSALMGQKVSIIFKNGKTNDVLGVYATEDNTVYNTVMNAVEKDGSKISLMVSPTPLRAPSRSMSTALVLQRLKAIARRPTSPLMTLLIRPLRPLLC